MIDLACFLCIMYSHPPSAFPLSLPSSLPPSLSPSLPPYLLPDLPLLFQNAADDQGTPGSQALRRTGECELRDLAVSSVNIY